MKFSTALLVESRVKVVCDPPTVLLEKAVIGQGTPGRVLTSYAVLTAHYVMFGDVPPTGASVKTD